MNAAAAEPMEIDRWAAHLRRSQDVAVTWLSAAGVLDAIRAARRRVGAPSIAVELVVPAVADLLGISLLVNENGDRVSGPFQESLTGDARTAQMAALQTASHWIAAIDQVAGDIQRRLPRGAPF